MNKKAKKPASVHHEESNTREQEEKIKSGLENLIKEMGENKSTEPKGLASGESGINGELLINLGKDEYEGEKS
ncbi:hypothetical protein A9B99_14345 [Mangrovibacter phragmitis]|uniref:Uncharacterized protein n=1 Tax=Mangrovibacter phragmitis TaxID=1691903 RepID=A0A1B7KZE0_9ENTR|nr:hypothetical protein [Mangrovibacter phragmitis]OAT75489.1 hypothetical protein A9B99_14345 [Mangrovibacter phragmitis]